MELLLSLIAVLALGICCLVYNDLITEPVKKELYQAGNNKDRSNYQADIENLTRCIGKAKYFEQLELAEGRITAIQKKYSKLIDQASLQYDINELKRHIGLQEIIIGQHPTVLN